MKTKNVKVKLKDLKKGRIIYVAHPVYGIDKYIVKSKTFMEKDIGLFFKVGWFFNGKITDIEISTNDSGIQKYASRNNRRTFFKEKHAIEYASKMETDKGFIKNHCRHLHFVADCGSCFI